MYKIQITNLVQNKKEIDKIIIAIKTHTESVAVCFVAGGLIPGISLYLVVNKYHQIFSTDSILKHWDA